ncbi:hypothetical protein TNCV_1810841 [Trichonephila clavipes]|nr:hypothetical protein TNCV_1810841 [Trichonephila clavipes]
MYGRANDNGRTALRMYHAQLLGRRMPDHRIFHWLHRKLRKTRSFHVNKHDAGRRRAVGSPSLEESILNVVPDRPESSVRRARWPFRTLYCLSFKHVLHQTSSMRSGIIILENKGISNGSSVRDDMRSKYLVCIPSARQSAIPNDMQVRTSAYADSTPYHPTSSSVL